MKVCFRCKSRKPVAQFFLSNNTADGFHSWCKQCCAEGSRRSHAKVNSTIEGRARVFLRNAKNAAEKRGQEFSISLQDIIDCWSKQHGICAYSGRQMVLEAGSLETVSIERINSEIGYTPENTILVCRGVNALKSNFKFDDFYAMCRDVALFLGDEDLNLAVEARK